MAAHPVNDSPSMDPLDDCIADTGGNGISFNVGDTFASFSELEEKLSRYSTQNYIQLWKRDARTIAAAKKRVGRIAGNMPDALKYQSVKFCCIHGGKKFATKASERSSSTFKKDCPFNIYVVASKDGRHLEVRSIVLDHNHDLSEALFRHLPQQRKLPPELEEKATAMLQLKANKKLVRERLEQESSKVVTLKDLSNIAAKGNNQAPETTSKPLYQCCKMSTMPPSVS
ncbi:uncharacterized protein LOC144115891 [Amblyomma americanum]